MGYVSLPEGKSSLNITYIQLSGETKQILTKTKNYKPGRCHFFVPHFKGRYRSSLGIAHPISSHFSRLVHRDFLQLVLHN